MTEPRNVYVHTAELVLHADDDPRAPGGAVTLALCGAYEHDPPCRWPNNNSVFATASSVSFRTVFVATPTDEPKVRVRIEAALHSGTWQVVSSGVREPDAAELAFGRKNGATA